MMRPSAAVLRPLHLPRLSSPAAGLRCPQRRGVPIPVPLPPRPFFPASLLPPAETASPSPSSAASPPPPRAALSRRALLSVAAASAAAPPTPAAQAAAEFFEIEGSGGVKALDLRAGDGEVPRDGDQVAIHYYGRLAAKRGWRFDSTYDHKDGAGDPVPFVFVVGSGKSGRTKRPYNIVALLFQVISGIDVAVKSMRLGGIRRIIIPPSQGYQNTSQEPIPPNYFDRQRLFTTIFNPTRLNNGEGSTLGTLIFDIELLRLRHL